MFAIAFDRLWHLYHCCAYNTHSASEETVVRLGRGSHFNVKIAMLLKMRSPVEGLSPRFFSVAALDQTSLQLQSFIHHNLQCSLHLTKLICETCC
ncbi:unnamed protein product, partial [Ixodes persulcatus]